MKDRISIFMLPSFAQNKKFRVGVVLVFLLLFFFMGGVMNVANPTTSSYASPQELHHVSEEEGFGEDGVSFSIGVLEANAQEDTEKNKEEEKGAWFKFGLGEVVILVVGFIADIFNYILGLALTLMIKILVSVANYGNVVDVEAVTKGWVMVRDICNMFIVLILLFIAFATILKIESYNAKQLLPKLLIVAIIINFSRAIFGWIIDLSQVIMLSFAVPLAEADGAWFIEAFNVQQTKSINPGGPEEGMNILTTTGAIILSTFAILVSFIVIVVMLVVLVIRLVMLWVYTILSPLIFLGFAFPPIQKYVGSMWQDFIKQVIVGPLLMFFIWLALKTAHDSVRTLSGPIGEDELTAAQTTFFQEGNLERFIITIALLIGGLIATQQIGGAAGSAAGKGVEAVRGRYGPTPMRWGRERLDAFKSRREGERKQKAERGGQRLYELYKGTTQKPKAVGAGAKKAMGMPGAGEMWKGVNKGAEKIPGVNQLKQWKQKKDEHQGKINEAFEQGQEVTSNNGKYIYSPDENNQRVEVKDKESGEKVTSMGKKEADFRRGYKEGYTPAKQIIDEGQKQRVDEKQKELGYLDASELKQVLDDRDASTTDKIAASLLNVQKQNFGSGEEDKFNKAKEYASRSLSTKKSFNEEADKKYAGWNNTREELVNKVDNGEVDLNKQDLSQYKEKLGDFAEAAGENFGKMVEEVSKRGSKANKHMKEALEEKIQSYENVNTEDSEQKNIRKSYAEKTGDFVHAYSSPNGQQDKEAMTDFVKSAKSDRLNNIVGAYQSESTPEKHKETMKEVLQGTLTQNQVDNYGKKDVPDKNVKTLQQFLQEGKASGQRQDKEPTGGGSEETGGNENAGSGQFAQNTED